MKIIIFGIGNYYQIQKTKLKILSDIEIVAFADNNAALWGKTVDGSPVIPPAEILTARYDKVIIISLYVSEIFHQLMELGVERDKVISWPHFWSDRMKGKIEIFSLENRQEKRAKKVLVISNDLNYDGASLAAVYAAIALNKHWSAVLAVPAGNRKLIKEIVNAGIEVAVCQALPWFGAAEEIWIEQFDAVIVNSFPMIESALAVRKIRPVLWWFHEPSGNYPIVLQQYPDGIRENEFRNIELCAVSRKALECFNRVWPKRFGSVLPLGIPDKLRKDKVMDRQNKKTVFAIIGGVSPLKGQNVFLDAAERIVADAEFWLIGRIADNAYCRRIREKAEIMDSVRMLGELIRHEMDRILSEIDAVVWTSQTI